MNSLKRIFNPTSEEREEDWKRFKAIHDEVAKKRGCSSCKHCIKVRSYPGFVTAEECKCDVGLECDTVLFSIENCEQWEDRLANCGADMRGDKDGKFSTRN